MTTTLATISTKLNDTVTKIDTAIEQLENLHANISDGIKNNLNVSEILKSLDGIWEELDSAMDPVEGKMTETLNSVSSFLNNYHSPVKAVLLVLAIPFLLATILFTLFLIVFIVEAIYRHLFSLNGSSPSEGNC
ncbi:unnamed protein product [Dibothriocephalus latus]|uniref:Uncharacterized protein n=1 Tax=Dibothriocephalus latus TaxID=60516 RepID=A0A3P6RGA0_DIBLA|nr:unnamed protein product [Dibothriocephalus latus]